MTIKEIAELAGVSIATVSKIVNGKDQNITPETRSKVLRIVQEYHYTPYSKIRSSSSAKTFLLAALLHDISQNSDLICGIMSEAQSRGYGILLFDTGKDPDLELKHITALIKHKVDGAIWEPAGDESVENKRHLTSQGIPFIQISTSAQEDFFHIDYAKISYSLTESLAKKEHRKIACLVPDDETIAREFKDGFMQCLFDRQIPYSPDMLLHMSAPDHMLKLLSGGFSGIVGLDFKEALDLYKNLEAAGRFIPADFSLVSAKKDRLERELQSPAISGLAVPFEQFGHFVCDRLISVCEKEKTSSPTGSYAPAYTLDHQKSIERPPSLRRKKIVVIGSINIDNTFHVDCLPQLGKTTRILDSSLTLGGKGANQAVGASRLGHEVSLIGKIGNDPEASLISRTLENENVSFSGVSHDRNEQTGKAFIYLVEGGESTISILAGANDRLNAEDIRKNGHLFRNAGYTLLSTEVSLPAIIEAAKISRENGAKNILKPAALTSLPKELLQYIDILVPNRKEAGTLCPEASSPCEQADIFLRSGFETVIITLGHDGCYLRTKEASRHFPAADFTPVDTTGGADAFISALASYLTAGQTLEDAVQIATYAAGFCISKHGTTPSLVDKYSLEQYLASQNTNKP